METWFLLNSGAGNPAMNMALDEGLLDASARLARPVLRFYSWTGPAASFGYFQHYSQVASWTPLRPLIRRPTGGGLVPHDGDWTYSLIFPPAHPWFRLRAIESYRQLHLWMQAAFRSLGVATAVTPDSRKEFAGQCFSGPEQYDLVWQGRKLAGAAQRRAKMGFLIQGSIQPRSIEATVEHWQGAVVRAANSLWNVAFDVLEPDSALLESAEHLARTKYSQTVFNEHR